MTTEQELVTLRGRVSDLENRIQFIYKKLNIEYVEEPSLVNPKIAELLRMGNKIEAIKVYRETNDVSLAEAKQAVEEMATRLGL